MRSLRLALMTSPPQHRTNQGRHLSLFLLGTEEEKATKTKAGGTLAVSDSLTKTLSFIREASSAILIAGSQANSPATVHQTGRFAILKGHRHNTGCGVHCQEGHCGRASRFSPEQSFPPPSQTLGGSEGLGEAEEKTTDHGWGWGQRWGGGRGRYMPTVKILIMEDHERVSAPFVQQEAYYYLG